MNMGGSILPSENEDTLKPVKIGKAVLKVIRVMVAETYMVICVKNEKYISALAGHANGHSCKSLIDRIETFTKNRTADNLIKVQSQFEHILRCGGVGMEKEAFTHFVSDLEQ